MSNFYLRLKDLRKEKNVSQKSLADEIQYGQSTICDWEKGRIEPTADALIMLAKYFDVTTDYLLGLENEDGSKIK